MRVTPIVSTACPSLDITVSDPPVAEQDVVQGECQEVNVVVAIVFGETLNMQIVPFVDSYSCPSLSISARSKALAMMI